MEHEQHISDKDEVGMGGKLLAGIVVLVLLAAIGGYVVYGSGMWNPPIAHTSP